MFIVRKMAEFDQNS